MKIYPKAFCLFLIVLCSLPAIAMRYEEAVVALKEERYDLAMRGFLELSALGNKDAQYQIGFMHLNGQSVKESELHAYAWVTLAASNLFKTYLDVLKRFEAQVDNDFLTKATPIIERLKTKYSDDIIEKRIKPVPPKTNKGIFKTYYPIKKKNPTYPRGARKKAMSGVVQISYTIDKHGRTKYHEIKTFSDNVFVNESLKAAKSFIYKPAQINGLPVDTFSVINRFTFQLASGTIDSNKLLEKLENLKHKAQNGSSLDRYRYANANSTFRKFLSKEDRNKLPNYNRWYYMSAVDGLPSAKYELGRNVLYGEQCEADDALSLFWLKQAANDGLKEAQLLYGIERFKGVRYDKNEAEGILWLEKAARAGSNPAKIELSRAYAMSSNTDIEKALTLINSVDKKYIDQMSLLEVKALIYSLTGDTKGAIKAQKRLVKLATKYELPFQIYKNNLLKLQRGKNITSI